MKVFVVEVEVVVGVVGGVDAEEGSLWIQVSDHINQALLKELGIIVNKCSDMRMEV